jgi:hypothetical protein
LIKKEVQKIFNQPGSLTAITVYITVVGVVYQVALRHLWQPTGFQMIVDELLHTLIPFLVIVYWALYEQRPVPAWQKIPGFLLYPSIYVAFILARGAISGFYPDPFVNVSELAWSRVLINIAILFAAFIIVSLLFVGIGMLLLKKND